jgi:chromate transporter
METACWAKIWLMLWLVPVALFLALLGPDNVFNQIAVFSSKIAKVTIGGRGRFRRYDVVT